MLILAYPWMLVLLPLPWLIHQLLPPYRKERVALREPSPFAEDATPLMKLCAEPQAKLFRQKMN